MTGLVLPRTSSTDSVPISGRQTTLRYGPYTAEIASVGATFALLAPQRQRPDSPLFGTSGPPRVNGHEFLPTGCPKSH